MRINLHSRSDLAAKVQYNLANVMEQAGATNTTVQALEEAAQKIGCGISHFTTQLDPEWRKHRHFVIVRTDRVRTDVSFHICIDGTNA